MVVAQLAIHLALVALEKTTTKKRNQSQRKFWLEFETDFALMRVQKKKICLNRRQGRTSFAKQIERICFQKKDRRIRSDGIRSWPFSS